MEKQGIFRLGPEIRCHSVPHLTKADEPNDLQEQDVRTKRMMRDEG